MRFLAGLVCLLINQSLSSQTPGNGLTDIDGNTYPTVIIGNQEWMASNLRTSHYNNGDSIVNVINDSIWEDLESGAWSYYNNDNSNDSIYGKLYNWYAVDDNRQLCPSGWEIPSDVDYDTLVSFLGGTWEAGGKLKEASFEHWNAPNFGATDEYGFSALPGGSRENGEFEGIGDYGYIWSKWANHPTTRHRWEFRHTQTIFAPFNVSRDDGYNCRCLKTNLLGIKEVNKTTIQIYPNPIQEELNIKVEVSLLGSVYTVYDNIGNVVLSGTINSENTVIELVNLSEGIYLFSVGENMKKTFKVIKK